MDIHMGAGQRMIPDTAAQARFQNFLKTYHGKKLVVLELGIGWRNQLIKAPMMRLVDSEPNATYVTLNLGEIYITDISKKSPSVWTGGWMSCCLLSGRRARHNDFEQVQNDYTNAVDRWKDSMPLGEPD